MNKTALAVAVAALALPGAAAAHIPFTDGPGSARQIQKALNADRDWENVTCRYARPHVLCRGFARIQRSDVYLLNRVTVHKTAPRKGYAMICVPSLGVCRRDPMTFSR